MGGEQGRRRTECRLQCSTPDGLPGSRQEGSLDQEKPILHRLSREKVEETRALSYTREREETPRLTVLDHPESQRTVKRRRTGCSVRHPRRLAGVPGLCEQGSTDPEPLPDRRHRERRNTSADGVGSPRKSAGSKVEDNRVQCSSPQTVHLGPWTLWIRPNRS